MRYFELAVRLALINEQMTEIVEGAITDTLEQVFFGQDNDILTQITIMDFIPELAKKPWAAQVLAKSNFLP